MTAADLMTLPHVAGLCAAIDADDDSALPPLADALEEAGEGRLAAGLRLIETIHPRGPRRPSMMAAGAADSASWQRGDDGDATWRRQEVPAAVYDRLLAAGAHSGRLAYFGDTLLYPSRHAAFLALAAAHSE